MDGKGCLRRMKQSMSPSCHDARSLSVCPSPSLVLTTSSRHRVRA